MHLTPRKKFQSLILLCLILFSALAELMTLGMVIPFLSLMMDPTELLNYPSVQTFFKLFGWNKPGQISLAMTILFVSITFLSALVRIALVWVTNRFTFGLGLDFSIEIYRRTLSQPYKFHMLENSSNILGGMNKTQSMVANVLLPFIKGIASAIVAVSIITMLFWIDPEVTFFAFAIFSIFYLLIVKKSKLMLNDNSSIIARGQTLRIQTVQEGLGGIRDILLDSLQNIFVNRFGKIEGNLRRAQAMNHFVSETPRYLIECIGITIICSLAYLISRRTGGLAETLPILGALALGSQKLLPLLNQIYISWSKIMGNLAVVSDVIDLLELPLDKHQEEGLNKSTLNFNHHIVLQGLRFKYTPESSDILKGIDLKVKKGEILGFVGKTGSGKSTLLDVIMGLLMPTEGYIFVDEQKICIKNVRDWQLRIAHVPQMIFLTDSSITENIAFGVKGNSIDIKRVKKAAEQAQIMSFIDTLENGLDTIVGERGIRLSGGQRQRIGIARALYKQPDLLILDEATSALDIETEELITKSVEKLDKNLTILIVAHRLSTLRKCDRIFKLKDGVIIEQVDNGAINKKTVKHG